MDGGVRKRKNVSEMKLDWKKLRDVNYVMGEIGKGDDEILRDLIGIME